MSGASNDALRALRLMRERVPDVPLIVLAGARGTRPPPTVSIGTPPAICLRTGRLAWDRLSISLWNKNQSSWHAPLWILRVDGNEDTSIYPAHTTARRRYTHCTFADFASVRAFAAPEDFDLLISEIGLPDGTGLELMDEINKSLSLPGIAISGFGSDEDIELSKVAGLCAHLTKPINLQSLEATIRRVVLAGSPNAAVSLSL